MGLRSCNEKTGLTDQGVRKFQDEISEKTDKSAQLLSKK